LQLVVKLHPGEDQRGIIYKENHILNPNIVSGLGAITYELLYASDILITHHCTTAQEALMLDKPVIVLDLKSEYASVSYIRSRAAIDVHSESALTSAINNILYNEAFSQKFSQYRKRFNIEYNNTSDGIASQKVADLVTKMISETKGLKE
jgi:CDP-glycerol glycerophosphotransferase (TagB/SpsB family)